MDLKNADPVVALDVLGYSEFRKVFENGRDGDRIKELVPAPCGFVHVHVMAQGGSEPFTVLVSEDVFEKFILPHVEKKFGVPALSLVPRHDP